MGGPDVSYVYFSTDLNDAPQPGDRQLAVAIDGGHSGGDDFWVLINMYDQPGCFDLSEWADTGNRGHDWRRIIDTAAWAEAENNCWAMDDALAVTGEYTVDPWSIVVLQAHRVEQPEAPHTLWGRSGGLQLDSFGLPHLRGMFDEVVEQFRRGADLLSRMGMTGPRDRSHAESPATDPDEQTPDSPASDPS